MGIFGGVLRVCVDFCCGGGGVDFGVFLFREGFDDFFGGIR